MTTDLSRVRVIRGRAFLFQVEASDRPEDYRKYEDLRQAVWGFPEDTLPGTRNMLCGNFVHDGSCLYLAVYAADDDGRLEADASRCVGFSYGFVGLKDKSLGFRSPGNLWFYSQYLGVLPAFQSYGLGILIKEFQRDILQGVLGLDTVVCTYDPLVGVNALRNIRHFRMEVVDYRPAVYGEFGGLLNRSDVPSDRFFMSWDLKTRPGSGPSRDEAEPAADRRLLRVGWKEVRGRSGPFRAEVVTGMDFPAGEESLFVPVPKDFYSMLRETDVEDGDVRRIPLEWRLKTREAFQTLFAKSWKITDFMSLESGNFYVMEKGSTKS